MGRIGEVITRTWQTADKMKRFRGQLGEEKVRTAGWLNTAQSHKHSG